MKCKKCNAEIPIKSLLYLSIKGRGVCCCCNKLLVVNNKRFIRFLLIVLFLFMGVTTYFFIENDVRLGLGFGWSVLTYLIPWIMTCLLWGILVVPALEITEAN